MNRRTSMHSFSLTTGSAKYLGRFLAWLLFFLIILELFVRNFFIHFPKQQFIPYFGVVPVEHSVAVWGVEGYGVTSYLSNGEVYTPFREGTISVVVLGDSYTEALQVSDEQKFVSVAEQTLHDNGTQANLHNLGVSGRSVADYVYMAPRILELYSPKVVIIQVTRDDFAESLNLSRPNYLVRNGKELEFVHNGDYFAFDLRWQNLIRTSGLGSLAVYKLTPLVKEQRLRLAEKEQEQEPITQIDTHGESNFEDAQLMVDILEEAYRGTHLVFLIIPVHSSLESNTLLFNSEDERLFVESIRKHADNPVLYPSLEFSNLYNQYKKFPRGFNNTLPNVGHLNADGNRVLGTALADYIDGLIK